MKSKRIGIRLEQPEREQIEKLVDEGKFNNISEVARLALAKFLAEVAA